MRGSGRNSRLWNGCVVAIAVVLVHLSQQALVTAHERGSSAVVLTIKPWHPLIVVPEPDPAMYGHLLLDRTLAKLQLVRLGK